MTPTQRKAIDDIIALVQGQMSELPMVVRFPALPAVRAAMENLIKRLEAAKEIQ